MKLKNLALLPLIVVGLNATTATNENVTKVYVADFDRAPDSAGLKYWVETSKLQLEEISQSFFDQDETKTKYPDTLSNPDFVNTIYKNAFNRQGDPDGITYWTGELDSGQITKGNMILAVVNGAKDTELGQDKSTIDNKTEVGLHFAASGSNDTDAAIKVMDGITDDDTTVELAKEAIDKESDDSNNTVGKTILLTTSANDKLTGTDKNDIFIGALHEYNSTSNTYNSSINQEGKANETDDIKGGAGSDTFKLTINNDFNGTSDDPIAYISAIENVNISSDKNFTIDTTHWTDVENYILPNVDSNITNIVSTVKSVSFEGSEQNSSSVTLTGANIGTSIAVNSSKATTDANITVKMTATTVVTQALSAVGNKKMTNFDLNSNTKLKTITVSGDSKVHLNTNATSILSVDASALNATFDYNLTTKEALTFKGAIKDNNITISAKSLNATFDDGDDTLVVTSDGDLNINTGKGNDNIMIQSGSGNNIIAAGIGQDDINITNSTGSDTIQVNGSADVADVNDTKIVVTVNGFKVDTDKIKVDGLPTAVNGVNYLPGTKPVKNATDALEEANSVMSGDLKYVNVSMDGASYLAFDNNGDGSTDGAILIEDVNITADNIK